MLEFVRMVKSRKLTWAKCAAYSETVIEIHQGNIPLVKIKL
jgi:hypothetical protein